MIIAKIENTGQREDESYRLLFHPVNKFRLSKMGSISILPNRKENSYRSDNKNNPKHGKCGIIKRIINNANMIYINLVYNFAFGKNKSDVKLKMQNKDRDSGILNRL